MWWMAVSGFAFGLTDGVVAITNWWVSGAGTRPPGPNDYLVEALVAAIGGALVIGLSTGIALVRLLRNERIPQPARLAGSTQA